MLLSLFAPTRDRQEAIARETQSAKTLAKVPAKKVQALNALRRRKVQEQLAVRIDGWLMQVEELLGGIEQAQATAAVVQRLREGNEALKVRSLRDGTLLGVLDARVVKRMRV